jgi:uncharacterized protein YjlB
VPLIETIKESVEKLTGFARPSWPEVDAAVRPRKPRSFGFGDDGMVPNSRLPLVIYRNTVRLTGASDPAALFEVLFARHGWKGSWRDGIYDFSHYHSRTHEVLGFARGTAKVRFGGARGRIICLKAGDVAILPAGTGHQRIEASPDLLVVGAYPTPDRYDECRASPEQHDAALKQIARVPMPKKDPVYGPEGALLRLWLKDHSGHLPKSLRAKR